MTHQPHPSTPPGPSAPSLQITALVDPLCGWCHGAGPALTWLAAQPGVALRLAPTGLFAGTGRVMSEDLAAYAWGADQRIAAMTGQVFSQRYRREVLGATGQAFDSAAATLALTAVSLTAPADEARALHALQAARYVQGQDLTDPAVLQTVLRGLGLADAAARLQSSESRADLLDRNATRLRAARALMQAVGAQGVPALVAHGAAGPHLLDSRALYAGPAAWPAWLTTANKIAAIGVSP